VSKIPFSRMLQELSGLVPHNQGEQLYMALNKACKGAAVIGFLDKYL
jgi:hypothetical protein